MSHRRWLLILVIAAVGGGVWWVIWNVIQYITVLQAGGIARSGPALESEKPADWSLVVGSGELPWGYGYFPWMPVVLACLTAVCVIIVTSLPDNSCAPQTSGSSSISSRQDGSAHSPADARCIS